jgi:transcriptional regulator with XRE-family HTH domain
MKERIKQIRKALDLTQAEFAERIGSVQNTITGYETGRRSPSNPVISSICHVFGVDEEWLRTGKGTMFVSETDEIDSLVRKYNLSNSARIVIEKFVKLNESDRQIVMNYYKEIAAALIAEEEISTSKEMTIDEKVEVYRRQLEKESLDITGNDIDTVSAAEAAYENALHIAHRKDSTASNTSRKREA